jgi:hypothetical protein
MAGTIRETPAHRSGGSCASGYEDELPPRKRTSRLKALAIIWKAKGTIRKHVVDDLKKEFEEHERKESEQSKR